MDWAFNGERLSDDVPSLSRVACPWCGRTGSLELDCREGFMALGMWTASGWRVPGADRVSPVVRAPRMPVMVLVCLASECAFVAEPAGVVYG